MLAAGFGAIIAGVVTLHAPGRAPADAGVLPPLVPSATPAAPRTSAAPDGPADIFPAPARVVIAALKVDAPVDPAGVTHGGELGIPEDPSRLGWWIGSAQPGEPRGTVLIAGHVDTRADGPGALFRLEDLPMGAAIQVRADGRTQQYRAVARRSYVKRRLPADLFSTGTEPRLALITCGGTFRDGTYSHNVVVYAEPVR
ncbi:peptidase C60, sortase A and B [Actinoplanes sp. N902-109]|nr:peptidase C60, sortase A and B [Actinoplanes sp. N902-109]